MLDLSESLGVSRSTMWVGLGIFHALLGTRFLGGASTITAAVLYVVAIWMTLRGLRGYRAGASQSQR
ncbi:hypothetical protein [Halanaeroarchaeum sp. HSR-CO]|uniref:hypothetical protein n=1 Tax=Halanaeroarchaeum sp. HSR-CO TaxID=2866382 RepID=UPI00217D9FBF|nr:hypothetical protein [Halanaeroarchaeum sp. HSR-CO]